MLSKKFIRRALLIGIMLPLLFWHEVIPYAAKMGVNQLDIVLRARPIEEVMKDQMVPDSIKAKLSLVNNIRTFAFDTLGIAYSTNYTEYFDQKGKPILWVVSASEKFNLKAYEWHFPFLGAVPYKGYFNKSEALSEALRLTNLGYDTDIGMVSGWSTLGWFKDPVLSGMLRRSEGRLANLLIHELCHSSIFVPDSVDLNENLASFCGEEGALRYLRSKFGQGSKEQIEFANDLHDEQILNEHMLHGAEKLKHLYSGFSKSLTEQEKEILKSETIRLIFSEIDSLPFKNPNHSIKKADISKINNTYFLDFLRYDSRKEEFRVELNEKFDGNFQKYFNALKKRYPAKGLL